MIKSKIIIPNSYNSLKKNINNYYQISKSQSNLDEMVKEILTEEMNKECFDCGSVNPKYISINNGIFLCLSCVKIHYQFPKGISTIKNNNLFLLTNKELLYIYYGGNHRLNNFVNYEYPGLQNYQPNILYQTQAMNYYRCRLNALVLKRKKPLKLSSVYAYKLIGENSNKYSKNRILFENMENNNINNMNNANMSNIDIIENDTGKNIKYIYNGLTSRIKDNRKSKPKISEKRYIGQPYSPYANNSLEINFNKTTNWNEYKNKNKDNYRNTNVEYVNQNLYNQTFFEEMKNIFKQRNLKSKLKMKLGEKDNDKKSYQFRDELLTHQASLSNTIFFPTNNLLNNGTPYNNNKLFKKINIHQFNSLRTIEKDKDKNYVNNNNNSNSNNNNNNYNNNTFYKVYIKPRMSNNSFSKNSKNLEINDSNFSRKTNSIINGMSKFSLKNLNIRHYSPINRIENGYISESENFFSKSCTTRNLICRLRDGNYPFNTKNRTDNNIPVFKIRLSDNKLNKNETSFNSYNRKINLNINECCNSNSHNNSKEKYIKDYIDNKKEKRLYENHNLINNNNKTKKTYNSLITVNRISKNNNLINLNEKDNIVKSDNKHRNFIKVIKAKIGKQNISDDDCNNIIDNCNVLYNNIQTKLNHLNKKEVKNNIFLGEGKEKEKQRKLRAIIDKKEQETIENEALNNLLNENYLLDNNINKRIINKNEENSEDIVNGGFNNSINFNSLDNTYNDYSFKNNQKENINEKYLNEDIYFYNKKNCTDLIILSKTDNHKKNNKYNDNIIPNNFLNEVKNIFELISNHKVKKNKNISKSKNKNVNFNLKTTIDIINNNSFSLNNIIKNSIRNKYKQKSQPKNNYTSDSNKSHYETLVTLDKIKKNNHKSNTINEFIFNEIKNLNISEDNWNINQIGELYKFQEIFSNL